MVKLLILDKDGTLTRPKSGQTFVQHPEDQELIPGVAEALQRYRDGGWFMAIASNQGGVAAGHKTLEEAIEEMRFAMRLIEPFLNYEVLNHFRGILCPDMDGKTAYVIQARSPQGEYRCAPALEYTPNLNYRKPSAGMLTDAEQWLRWSSIIPIEVLMVGDRPEDEGAAQAAGVNFMWAEDWIKAVPNG